MAGWPWPLSGIQAWFDDLWKWISESAASAVKPIADWVNDSAAWLWKQVQSVGTWIVDSAKDIVEKVTTGITDLGKTLSDGITGAVDSIGKGIGDVGAWLHDQVTAALAAAAKTVADLSAGLGSLVADTAAQLSKGISDVGAGLSSTLSGLVDGAQKWAGDAFAWLNDQVQLVGSNIAMALDGAVTGIGEALTTGLGSVFGGLIEGASNFFAALSKLTAVFDPSRLIADALANTQSFLTAVTSAFTASSPRTPEEAFYETWNVINQVTAVYMAQTATLIVAEAASVGQLDVTLEGLAHTPQIEAGLSLVAQLYSVMSEASLVIPLRQYFMRAFTPQIPGPQDLIRFVVREVIDLGIFRGNLALQGFSAFWADAFWEAHWRDLAADQIQDAYHRGIIAEAERDKFLVLIDYRPTPRPGISKSDLEIVGGLAKTLIPRVDLRRGYAAGRLARDELTERYQLLGYEEDSALMADIQVALAFTSERAKLRDNAKDDFVRGFILEGTLRADLAALEYGADAIDYYVADARADRERKHKQDLLAQYKDGYLKDLVTDDELLEHAKELILDPDTLTLFLDAAYISKYKKPKA